MPKLIKTPITQNTHNFDLSLLVKKYISNQTNEQEPPFNYSQFRRPYIRNHNQYYYQTAMKASLSDWRGLIDRSQTANKNNKDNIGNNAEINGNETPSKTYKNNKSEAPRSKTQANVRSDRKIDLQQSYISRNTYSNIKYNKNRTKIINQNEQSNSVIRNNNRMTATTTRQFDNRSYVKFNVNNTNNTHVQMLAQAQKTSTSFRESHLDSALVQNYYQAEYIKERAIQTAKIRRHYQKPHQNRPVSINCENTTNMKIHINSDNNFNSHSYKKLNLQQTNTPITPLKPHKQYKQMGQEHQNQNQQQNKCYDQFQQYQENKQVQQQQQQVKKFQLNSTMLKQKQNILSKNINKGGNRSTNINMYINTNRNININSNINKRQMYKSGKIISNLNCDKDGYWMPEKYQKVSLKRQFIRRVNDIIIQGLKVSPQKQYNKINNQIEGGLRYYKIKK